MSNRSSRVLQSRPRAFAVAAFLFWTFIVVIPDAHAEVAQDGGCRDVLFVGARGSGQPQSGITDTKNKGYDGGTGFGPEVYRTYTSFAAKTVNPVGITYHPLNFPAHDVMILGFNASGYFVGLELGVQEVLNLLRQRADASACPDERIVLAGYSQGAMVMHRAVLRLTNQGRDDIIERLDGVILIGDGDRIAGDNTLRYGSAGEVFQGIGMLLPSLSGSMNQTFPTSLSSRIHSFCNARDPICDASNFALVGGGKFKSGPHSKYVQGKNYSTIGLIATRVATRVLAEWQPPPPPPPPPGGELTYFNVSGPAGFMSHAKFVTCPPATQEGYKVALRARGAGWNSTPEIAVFEGGGGFPDQSNLTNGRAAVPTNPYASPGTYAAELSCVEVPPGGADNDPSNLVTETFTFEQTITGAGRKPVVLSGQILAGSQIRIGPGEGCQPSNNGGTVAVSIFSMSQAGSSGKTVDLTPDGMWDPVELTVPPGTAWRVYASCSYFDLEGGFHYQWLDLE